MPDDQEHERTSHVDERIESEGWDDDEVVELRISKRMLDELIEHGETSSAGTRLVGLNLLRIEVVHYEGIDD